MKLTASQQFAIRSYLEEVNIIGRNLDEIYDHVITAMEARPSTSKFSIREVKRFVATEFDASVNNPSEVKHYQLLNKIVGFVVFFIALGVYWKTMEPTVSFWDCGEFIAAASKMEVGHQPGAPLFMVIGKFFSLLALGNTGKIAYWVNFGSVCASAGTIMFLFWTITALASKVFRNRKIKDTTYSIIAAGSIGALAYTFSDTFWFSAVEAEVYALSSLFTAITFWAMLKWESSANDRWLILIAFITGLSIGVHLLSLLTLPALSLIYYYKKATQIKFWGVVKAGLIGCTLVGLVQFGFIQYIVLAAAHADLFFVNNLKLYFGSGALFFIFLLGFILFVALRHSIKTKNYRLNLSLLCTVFLLFGFSSYFVIIIRANAQPTINLSNPDNAFSLYDYLGRTNYEAVPLLRGKTFDAQPIAHEQGSNTYRKGINSYEKSGNETKTTYDKNMLFPRTFSDKPNHVNFYRHWLDLAPGQTPTFADNLKFFTSWQLGVMYWRYFFWNFAGRQNDEQGYGDIENGNWLTGIKKLDALRLGNQNLLPESITQNKGYNVFFGLPFILGIVGLIWLLRHERRIAFVVSTLFFCTGMAIILYINQSPMQVRERDYAYVGSFYAFCILIGFSVLGIKSIVAKLTTQRLSLIFTSVVCLLAAPVLMAVEGWDDHDRSGKTTALDWAKNYLNSCAENAILFTNADNDTYPLWYAQEVEGIRTDVRVICIQFLSDASFINQLKKKVNKSDPIPMSMPESKYVDGVRDYFPYVDYGITDSVELADLLAVMTSDNVNDKVEMNDGTKLNFLPTRKFKFTINPAQIVSTGTITKHQQPKAVSVMEWDFKEKYALKSTLAMMDILVTNNWKRPIYFATSVSEDTYMGLDKYLYLEGYAYRLLPLTPLKDQQDKTERSNSMVMYSNIVNKFDFSGFTTAQYLDPESRRVLNASWRLNNTLAANLIQEGKTVQAKHVMDKSLKELPLKNYAVGDTLNNLYTVQNLYALRQLSKGNEIVDSTVNFLHQELNYVASLTPQLQQMYRRNIELSLYVLGMFERLSNDYGQKTMQIKVQKVFDLMTEQFNVRS